MQEDYYYLAEWGFKQLEKEDWPTWITWKNKTLETGFDKGVVFSMNPTEENKGEEYELYYILQDTN